MEQVLNEPFFDASDIETVRKGGFGVAKIHEVSDREIAVVIACLVQGDPENALAPFLEGSLPVDDELLVEQQQIDTEPHEKSFAAISLGGDERDEIQHYLEAKPGFGLSLSTDEITTLQALNNTVDASKVEDPSLIIYEAMLELPGVHLVSNGDQTRTIHQSLEAAVKFGLPLHQALPVPRDAIGGGYFR